MLQLVKYHATSDFCYKVKNYVASLMIKKMVRIENMFPKGGLHAIVALAQSCCVHKMGHTYNSNLMKY